MKILIHGEDSRKSREERQLIKDGFDGDVRQLDGKELAENDLIQNLQGSSLFGEQKKLIIIDDLLTNKTLGEFQTIPSTEAGLLFWEGKKLSTSQIAKFQKLVPGLEVREFKVDQVVFQFLEALKPKQTSGVLALWQMYQKIEAPEIIFVMVVRQFRLLLLSKTNSKEGPAEWLRMSPWQRKKLENQAKFFSLNQIKEAYQKLLEIDFKIKSGQSPLDFGSALELFLLNL